MYKRLFAVALTFGMAAAAPPAHASSCAPREAIISGLEGKYSENLTSGGLQTGRGSTSVVEIWTSEDTHTFTVLLTRADGTSCIIAAGTDYFKLTPKLAKSDTPS